MHRHFEPLRDFVSDLVGALDFNAQIGALTFTLSVQETVGLTDPQTAKSAIENFEYKGGATFTHTALDYVRTQMLTPEGGARSDVPNAVVVCTDGLSNIPASTKVSVFYQFVQASRHR